MWTPADITPTVWYDATVGVTDAGSGHVSQWNDQSGNGKNLVQATDGNRPITGTRTQNGRNVLDFNGTSHRISGTLATLSQAQPLTTLVVLLSDNGANSAVEVYLSDAGGVPCEFRKTTTNKWGINAGATTASAASVTTAATQLVNIVAPSSAANVVFNGVAGTPGDGGANVFDSAVRVGCDGNSATFFNGWIAEVVLYNGNLSTANRALWNGYCNQKWAIAPASGAALSVGSPAQGAGTGTANNAQVTVSSPAGNAAGTGAAFFFGLTVLVAPTAGNAAATGAASNPGISGTVSAAVAQSGTGFASDATISISKNVPATVAAGTGAANDATLLLASNAPATVAPATGTANNATPTGTTNANAGNASGTGTAYNALPTGSGSATATGAAGTGTASNATVTQAVSATSGNAAGAGTAYNATVTTGANATNVSPSVAAGTGTAVNPGVQLGAGRATGTGLSSPATDTLRVEFVNAEGIGSTDNATSLVTTNAVTAVGMVPNTDATIPTPRDAALGTGTANNATVVGLTATVSAESCSGTGQAFKAFAINSDNVLADVATGTGTAYNATAVQGQLVSVFPTVATGTGSASDETIVFPATGTTVAAIVALATGAANGTTSTLAVAAVVALSVGVAYQPFGVAGTLPDPNPYKVRYRLEGRAKYRLNTRTTHRRGVLV